MPPLPQSFYNRPTLTVARELLGQRLVRELDGQRLSGLIVETEAYIGPEDTANHAREGRNRTPRNEVMFGPAGQSYIYLIYGMYHMLNVITERVEFPAAVLIRAIEPEAGLEEMRRRRSRTNRSPLKPVALTNGPGKLSQALGIDRSLNDQPLTEPATLWIEDAPPIPDKAVATGPRIGIDFAEPKDRDAPWRFWVQDNRFVSVG